MDVAVPAKDPFVSSPPEHWLELAEGLPFTEWGTSEAETPVLPEFFEPGAAAEFGDTGRTAPDIAEFADEFDGTRRAAPDVAEFPAAAAKRNEASAADFVDTRMATPAEVEFVNRKVRSTEAKQGFLTFSDKRNTGDEAGAKFVTRQQQLTAPAERMPARFFHPLSPPSDPGGERGENFVPVSAHSGHSGHPADRAKNVFPQVNSGTGGANSVGQNVAVPAAKRNLPEARPSFAAKENVAHQASQRGAVFPETKVSPVSPVLGDPRFIAPGPSGPQNSADGKFVDYSSAPFPRPEVLAKVLTEIPAAPNVIGEFPRQVSSPVNSGQRASSGLKDSAYFPAPARNETAGIVPSGLAFQPVPGATPGAKPETANPSLENGFAARPKWAELPEIDLAGGEKDRAASQGEHLRQRRLAQLESEQKGERWSV